MGIRDTANKIMRVLLVSSKPTKEEYVQSSKITGMGILIIGILGFAIFLGAMLLAGGA